jgi:hypothetical protein
MSLIDIQMSLIEFERVDTSSVDHLDRTCGMGPNHPRDVVRDLVLRSSLGDPLQEHPLISQEYITSGV